MDIHLLSLQEDSYNRISIDKGINYAEIQICCVDKFNKNSLKKLVNITLIHCESV